MQTLSTLNNIIVITLCTILLIRAALWYFKMNSPFLKSEGSQIAFTVATFATGFTTTISYLMHGMIIERVLYINGCIGSIIVLTLVANYLMELRENIPDKRDLND